MEGGNALVHGGLEKTKNALVTWGVPAVGIITGIVLGDALGIGKFLNDLIPIKLGDKAMGIMTAAAFAVAGTLIWSHFGIIGRFVGALFFGMAIGTIYLALTGKQLVIPGFAGGG